MLPNVQKEIKSELRIHIEISKDDYYYLKMILIDIVEGVILFNHYL